MQDALFDMGDPDGEIDWTYAIGAEDSSIVKIGHALDVPKRLREIQTGNPARLIIRWKAPGGRPLEGVLHRRFDRLRLQGEWFDFKDQDPVAAIREAVNAHAGGAEDAVENEPVYDVAHFGDDSQPLFPRVIDASDPDRDHPDYRPYGRSGCRYMTPTERRRAGLDDTEAGLLDGVLCFCYIPNYYCMLR